MSSPNKTRTPTFGEGDADTIPPSPDSLGGVPTILLGLTGSEGGGERFVRTDATIPAFDATLPTAVAATAAVGSSNKAARRDHRHNITADISTQRVEVADLGVLVGARKRLNFIAAGTVTITIADDPINNRIDITISA